MSSPLPPRRRRRYKNIMEFPGKFLQCLFFFYLISIQRVDDFRKKMSNKEKKVQANNLVKEKHRDWSLTNFKNGKLNCALVFTLQITTGEQPYSFFSTRM